MSNEILWWGYQHVNGTIQAKRYFGIGDLQEAGDSDFVDRLCGPFAAKDRDDALDNVRRILE